MKFSKRHSLTVFVAVALLMGASCSRSQVLTTLSAVVSAAEIALPVIGSASGAPPATIAQIDRYLQAVGKATAEASDILAGTGSTAEKSARIAQAFAGVAAGCNCVQAGTPSNIVTVVDAVARAVLNFLANFPQQGARTTAIPAAEPKIEIAPGDEKELANLRQRSMAIVGAIELKKNPKP